VIHLLAEDFGSATAIAIARSAEGKQLVLSAANVSWESADPAIVELANRNGSGGPDVDAPKVMFYAHKEGKVVVHVTVGGVVHDINVTVVAPTSDLDGGLSGEDAAVPDAGASSLDDAGVADAG
jgi:hypothetical protein